MRFANSYITRWAPQVRSFPLLDKITNQTEPLEKFRLVAKLELFGFNYLSPPLQHWADKRSSQEETDWLKAPDLIIH